MKTFREAVDFYDKIMSACKVLVERGMNSNLAYPCYGLDFITENKRYGKTIFMPFASPNFKKAMLQDIDTLPLSLLDEKWIIIRFVGLHGAEEKILAEVKLEF